MKKVAIALSGGVDSGVAAALLVKQGYQCAGFHMKLWREGKSDPGSLTAAGETCRQLGIPFYTVDFAKIFKKRVVDYFLIEYAAGLTPNPCVQCNKFIKFGELLDYVRKLGFDYLATGHYARIKTCHLFQAKDKNKDQSYFLYNLTQKQLAQILFPVGDYTKKEVRRMAREWQLPVAERPESQEICFFAESDYRPFLKRQISQKIVSGEVIDTQRRVIGNHQGILLYTIGQRHGFEIADRKAIGPWYVLGKDIKKNRLIVGFGKETEKKEFWVKNVNWLAPRSFGEVEVRIRHQGELLPARIKKIASRIKVILDEPERGIAPGQSAVFLKSGEVLGGGIIV